MTISKLSVRPSAHVDHFWRHCSWSRRSLAVVARMEKTNNHWNRHSKILNKKQKSVVPGLTQNKQSSYKQPLNFFSLAHLQKLNIAITMKIVFSVLFLLVLRGYSGFFNPHHNGQMKSDFERYRSQILSITILSYLNFWERGSISLFNVEC